MTNNISDIDPTTLEEVRGMNPAITAKCHATNQLALIEEEQRKLRKLKAAWKCRYTACLRAIDKAATSPEAKEARKKWLAPKKPSRK